MCSIALKSVMILDRSTMRSYTPPRNNRTQLRVGACALLLPPLALGAALYSMLAAPDEHTVRPAGPPAGTQAAQPIALAGETAFAESRSSVPATGAPQETGGRSAEDEARAPTSVPFQVASAFPAAVNPPAPDVDGTPAVSRSVRIPQSAPPEVSMTLPPRVLTSSGQVLPQPRIPAVQMPADQSPVTQARPAANPSSAESPAAALPAPVVRKRARPRYLGNLARNNGARVEARSEGAAAGRSVQPPSMLTLKDWLEQQFSNRPRNSGG